MNAWTEGVDGPVTSRDDERRSTSSDGRRGRGAGMGRAKGRSGREMGAASGPERGDLLPPGIARGLAEELTLRLEMAERAIGAVRPGLGGACRRDEAFG